MSERWLKNATLGNLWSRILLNFGHSCTVLLVNDTVNDAINDATGPLQDCSPKRKARSVKTAMANIAVFHSIHLLFPRRKKPGGYDTSVPRKVPTLRVQANIGI